MWLLTSFCILKGAVKEDLYSANLRESNEGPPRKYFKINFNDDTKIINITNNIKTKVSDLDLLALFFEDDDGLIIEIPSNLLLTEFYSNYAKVFINIIYVNVDKLCAYNANDTYSTEIFLDTTN